MRDCSLETSSPRAVAVQYMDQLLRHLHFEIKVFFQRFEIETDLNLIF